MRTVRFIHCADLHLDTPFRGLSDVASDVGRALNEATFKSFQNIVDLAIRESVDFVVIAGDVYDSSDRGLSAQFKFQKGVQRLAEYGIEVFVACGNHDPLSGWSATIEWPRTLHTFPANRVHSCQVTRDGQVIATVHGISYPKEAVYDNLAARFARPDSLAPSVAVLHANVGGDTAHLPYAPTTVSELATKGFTYWALGHVHAHRVLRDNAPAIVYPGCSQSRHPNETGPKGCCLVTLSDSAPPVVSLVPTDVVRFHTGAIDIAGCDSHDALRRRIVDECRTISAGSQGRHAVVRLALTGRTSLHHEIARANSLDALLHHARDELEGWEPWVWLEKLHLRTRGSYDIATQRNREDFVGDLMSVYDNLLDPYTGQLAAWIQEMDAAMSSWQGYRFLAQRTEGVAITKDELLTLAEQARGVTLDQLVEEP
jgi:DNA repair protein SbcD/Mre11